MSEARVKLELETDDGILSLDVAVSSEPLRLAALVPMAQRLTDVLVDLSVAKEKREGRAVSCAAGCGACCRQIVPLSPPEAFVLADFAARLDAEARDALIARFERVTQAVHAHGLRPHLEQLMRGDGVSFDALASDYFDMGEPCPFLLDESCGVHEHRPLICREYNVTSPAAWCGAPKLHSIRKIPMPPGVSYPLARLTAKLTGGHPELVPLPLAFEYAEAHAELAFRRWPGVELFEGLVAELKLGGSS